MKPEQQKNMYEVRKLRDQIDEIIKPAFNNWQSVEIVKNKLAELLLQDIVVVVDTNNDDEHALEKFI